LNKFLSLHIITINRVINCLPWVLDILSELYCPSGASRKLGAAERSGKRVESSCRKVMKQSGARSGRLRTGNGAGSGG